MKTFIISQPKAGTYLCTNILRNLGLTATGMHIKNSKYRKYPLDDQPTFYTKQELKKYVNSHTHHAKNFQGVLDLIKENQFAVGHLPCETKYINGLQTFKKVLLLRNMDSVKESLNRFKKEKFGNTSVKEEGYTLIEKWNQFDDVFILNFEEMVGKNYKKIDDLQIYLFGSIRCNSKEILDLSLAQPSLTKSSIR